MENGNEERGGCGDEEQQAALGFHISGTTIPSVNYT
jgi:hypothetical protein